jgi:hypothetical protein
VKTIKKHPITLIELMIAIGLTMVILTTLTFFYSQVSNINKKMDQTENEAFKMLYVESRLSRVIPRVPPETDSDIEFFFFTDTDVSGLLKPGSQSLVFTFDNGVKLDRQISYYVTGRLFLDEKGRFILATWPTPKRWKEGVPIEMKKEILMENVDSLEFRFFVPPEKGKTNKYKGWPIGAGGSWMTSWSKEIQMVPPLLKVLLSKTVDGKREMITYAFHLPNTSQPITFDQ